jgi:hypothetical protein
MLIRGVVDDELGDDAKIAAFGKTMWGGEFVYSVSRDFCRRCTVPTFLLPGTDKPHPAVTSDELKQLLPGLRRARLRATRVQRQVGTSMSFARKEQGPRESAARLIYVG